MSAALATTVLVPVTVYMTAWKQQAGVVLWTCLGSAAEARVMPNSNTRQESVGSSAVSRNSVQKSKDHHAAVLNVIVY